MKILVLFLMLVNLAVFAQDIPNAGFESWTSGNPDGWITDNIMGLFIPVTQSTENHSGSSAVKLTVLGSGEQTIPPYMYTWFPVSQRYGSLQGYYKFVPHSDKDVLHLDVGIGQGSFLVGYGVGTWETGTATSVFTQFTVPIEYWSSEPVDTAWIWIDVDDTSDNPSGGGYLLIDDLSWGGVVGVDQVNSQVPSEFSMQQNYPNPFNPSTMIEYTIPEESFVQLKIYDIVGNELTTLVNEYQPAGRFRAEFNAANLSSGIYIAKLTAGSFTKTMKMTLLK